MLYPSLQEIKKIESRSYDICPVCDSMLADVRDPISLMRVLAGVSEHRFLFESADHSAQRGRWTFAGFDPKLCITCKDGEVDVSGEKTVTDDPMQVIRNILAHYKSPRMKKMPPFTGGLVGYFAYDSFKYAEPSLELNSHDTDGCNDIDLMLFDKVIAYDSFHQLIYITVNIKLDDAENEYKRAESEIEKIKKLICSGVPADIKKGVLKSEPELFYSKDEYCRKVQEIKKHINEGDIFQAVLSDRISADFEGSLFDTYRVLRTTDPSPYMFYLSGTDIETAGASPETLVKLEDGKLSTFPLAGTRPRGENEKRDDELCGDLLNDEKENAEHNMLIDLGRNDLGKISRFNTVKVSHYHDILKFANVMHMGSQVDALIDEKYDALDAVAALLPAGTLSGAPKIRAAQILDELENDRRGLYGGGIGYISFSGDLDICIAIRFAYKTNNKLYIRSGAGIVYDSVPENEFTECKNKARSVLSAVKRAQEDDI
jgi:anthranilate synthase component 1